MKIGNFTIILSTALLFICGSFSLVKDAGFSSLDDCLITSDIGKLSFDQNAHMGDGSGVVAMADHFNKDHIDTVCSAEYSNVAEIRALPINEARKIIFDHYPSHPARWLGFRQMAVA